MDRHSSNFGLYRKKKYDHVKSKKEITITLLLKMFISTLRIAFSIRVDYNISGNGSAASVAFLRILSSFMLLP